MKRISILLFALAIAISSRAQTNIFKWLQMKNAGASDTAYVDGKAWYNPIFNHFTFIENGTAKHLGSGFSLPALSPGYIYVGNGSSVATPVPLGGDGSLSSAGSLTITGLQTKSLPSLTAGFLKYSGSAWTFDASTYLTVNQTITLSGDVSGSGATGITTTIGAGKVTNSMLAGSISDANILSSSNWNTAYNRSGTSLSFSASTFTFTKQDASTLTVSVPTFNQNTTGTAAAWTTGRTISITGDLAYTSPSLNGSGNVTAAGTLATVNSNVGTFGSATKSVTATVNGKGLITAISEQTLTPNVGSITGLGAGVGTWLTTPSWANFNSAITGTSPFWSLSSGGTLTGINTITSTTPSDLIFSDTWTATANNQFAKQHSSVLNSRSNANDVVIGDSFNSTITANAANIDGQPVIIQSTFNSNSGIATGANVGLSSPVGGYVSKSAAGMTVTTTFTSVAPTSTSGNGTGALFTVITNTATTFTSFNCTSSGSGYGYGETLTFNGSLFGGSGTIVLAVIATTGNGFALFSPLVLQNNIGDHAAITKAYISGRNSSGAELWEMGYYYNSTNAGVVTNNGIYLNDQSGSIFQSTPTALLINKTITNLNPTFTGTTTIANLNSSGIVTFSGTAGDNISTNSATLSFTGNPFAAVASQVKSNIRATNGVRTGVPATYSIQTAGSGYSNGSATTTGGTGTAASLTLTTSTGTITAAIPSPSNSTGSGTGYAINDVLNVVQVGGSSGQVKVTAIDGYGGIISLAADTRSFTDATSNNNYPSFYSAPTYTLAGSSASTWFGYYNPTYSSFGSGTKAGIVIVPSSALNAFGTATPLSTVDINGSIASAITSSAGSLSLDATNATIIIASGTGSYTLPSASGATRRIYVVVNQTGSARTISSYKDKSNASQTTVGANSVVWLQSDGSFYYQIN